MPRLGTLWLYGLVQLDLPAVLVSLSLVWAYTIRPLMNPAPVPLLLYSRLSRKQATDRIHSGEADSFCTINPLHEMPPVHLLRTWTRPRPYCSISRRLPLPWS